MGGDVKSMAVAFSDEEKLTQQANAMSEKDGSEEAFTDPGLGWDELEESDKAPKEVILREHFLKALERFNAGVSLTKIRRHYEKLGAKYSPVTFRKKWDELVRAHAEHG